MGQKWELFFNREFGSLYPISEKALRALSCGCRGRDIDFTINYRPLHDDSPNI